MLVRSPNYGQVLICLLFLLFHLPASVSAKDDAPKAKAFKLDSTPVDIRYFDDSEVILAQEENHNIWRSEDGGLNWKEIDGIGHGDVAAFWMNPHHQEWAVALGRKDKHWITKDRGKSWRDFQIPDGYIPALYRLPLSFHASDPEKVILKVQEGKRFGRFKERAYYTKNGFKDLDLLKEDTRECLWVKGTPQSKFIDDKSFDDRVLCIVAGDDSGAPEENKILLSDDYFRDSKVSKEPVTLRGRKIKGFVNMAIVKGYIIAAAKAEGSTELSLMVSTNGEAWHQGVFPPEHKVHEQAYTVLESSDYSIQVDVLNTRPGSPIGVLFSSDSNGTYFTENIQHTNRNMFGMVDFERITGVQGTMIVNIVGNWEEIVSGARIAKKLHSKITFDDGRTWNNLKDHSGNSLHLHSVTDIMNSGKIFSSPAPGLVMGVGNAGDHLNDYTEGDLWISDNAGLTWVKASFDGAHKYEFGDKGTILVAIDNEQPTKEVRYSLDHGDNWKTYEFAEEPIRAGILTTIPDSTTQKFTLTGSRRVEGKISHYIYTLDFAGIYEKKCEEGDFEEWSASDAEGKKSCVMGHEQTYRRRKKTANCYVGEKFKDDISDIKSCTCTYKDFECDVGYIPKGTGESMTCELASPPENSPQACKDGKSTFKGPSGFRLIPGNKCKDGVKKDEEIDRPCDVAKQPTAPDGKVGTIITTFRGSTFEQKVYLERGERSTGDDETIVMSVGRSSGSVARMFVTRDHGKNWKPIFGEDENYQLIIRHQYNNDRVFFISPNSKKVTYSVNRMETMGSFTVPQLMNPERLPVSPLAFHQGNPDYLIWTGAQQCTGSNDDCHAVAHFSKDRGDDDWSVLARYVRNCEFIERNARGETEELIYCEQNEDENPNGKLQLRAKADLGAAFETKVSDILAFATMSEFIIVAQKDPKSNLRLATSIDGQVFADAQFPHDFNIPVQNAYTVLDSSTHAIFLHVTTSSLPNFEFGRIVKSNENGTFYVTSLDYVNRDFKGFVDFEKMHGVDGVAMVNVVANPRDVDSGKSKKLRSLISHNDGAQWAPIPAPADNEGEPWACDTSNKEKCSLHLHSYTERDDAKHTFSSASAIGLMVAVGNVGEYLADINNKDETYTFISRDAGLSWKVAKKGRFLWEYGDQGSLVVLIEQGATNFGYYSLDEGAKWTRFEFNTQNKVHVLDLTTAPSDNSKQFLVWFRSEDGEVGTINLDFSSLKHGLCGDEDYELWKPSHPLQSNDCLFGQEMYYKKKKPNAQCWNGPKLERQSGRPTPCSCTRQDFECNYNYERTTDDVCKLVEGSTPVDPLEVCNADPMQKTYYTAPAYRKLRISGCVDGETTKYLGEQLRCPGHENDPDLPSERKGLSGFTFFLIAIVLPITAAAGIGYLVWSRIQSGAGFGRIRLGETTASSAFDADQPWVRYPVAVISGLVAIVTAVPLLIGAGWRALMSRFGGGRRYTSRQSFARGRGDYSIVEDEDELLGDDEEEA